MTGKSANEVPIRTGAAGMRAFAGAFMAPSGPPKAVIETGKDRSKNPDVVCFVGNLRSSMTSGEAKAFAESFENAVNDLVPGGRTPVTELCMTIRGVAARAHEWTKR